ncbi:ABC transporter substrate-binding protein [Halanaerobium sp. Z-7514]|uniref:ABC transporter substrate-binding protein n=1 Tax=Halanaerobium polyolivorans TaxID=2886943 RepID=A0AAW4WYD4_9FIRM|nr:ABC transporter substrate-binding protein [Halanaerobium polyolivorans]MCC3144467.1 ABC transporter substrate-binding protein [Halanaerobium polyolivorans]RQD75455.1 MAG: ABC transporter substrate-binding protein [Halanaerobium sp. MSAO_Bac5]
MKNLNINVNDNLYQITEKYPAVISVLTNKGFNQLDNEKKRKDFGSKISLKQAAALKNIDLAKLVELMESAVRENSQNNSQSETIRVAGSLPCPVKNSLTEELEKIRGEIDYNLELDLKSASQGLEWLKNGFEDIESEDELFDIFISAGFDLFFDRDLMDRFRRQDVFADATGIEKLNSDFEEQNIDLLDPEGDYSVLSIVPAVFLVNEEELNGRDIPRSWEEVMSEEFANSVSLPVSDFDLFNAILLNIYKSYGKEGVRKLGRSMQKAQHPSQMIKEGGRKAQNQAAVTIMPYFFTRMAKRFPHMQFIWPEDGAVISPIFMLSKKQKKQKLKKIIDLMASEKIGRILSEQGLFPSVLAGIDNNLPQNAKFMWPGWKFLREENPGQLLKELEAEFNNAVGVV